MLIGVYQLPQRKLGMLVARPEGLGRHDAQRQCRFGETAHLAAGAVRLGIEAESVAQDQHPGERLRVGSELSPSCSQDDVVAARVFLLNEYLRQSPTFVGDIANQDRLATKAVEERTALDRRVPRTLGY